MVVIGLILLAAAVTAAVVLVVQNDAIVSLHVFNRSWNVHEYWLAVAGLAVMAAAVLGLGLIRRGMARARRLRREHRQLAAENRSLAERVVDEPADAAAPSPVWQDPAGSPQ